LAGKLLDQNFGLLPYAPWFLVAVAGAWAAWRGSRRYLAAGAPYLLMTCLLNYPRVWGGSTYPGRTLVPLLPFLAVPLAAGLTWAAKGRLRRGVIAILIVVSLAQAWALTACPVLRYTSGKAWLAAHAARALRVAPFH